MIAIYKRELKSYFQNVLASLFICLNLLFLGLYFFFYNILSASPYLSYTLTGAMLFLVICVPVLAMRSMAEDRKQKTDQLLFTAPVSVGSIVVAKYLALLTIFAIPTLVAGLYPLVLNRFGTVPFAENYTALLGYFFMGAAFIAICVFLSSITENQIIAAVLGIGALLLGYLMPSICSLISSEGNALTNILSIYDLTSPAEVMYNKEFSVVSLFYYLSVIALFLFFTCQVIYKRRWEINKKTIKLGMFSSAYVAAAVVIVIAVNMIVTSLPSKFTSFDVSYEKFSTLSEDTKKMADALEKEVTIYVLSAENTTNATVKNTLETYENLSKKINVEYINPTVQPNFYLQYTATQPTQGSLIIVSGDKNMVVDYNDLYYVSTSSEEYYYYMYGYYGIEDAASGYDAEGQITSAINYVTSDEQYMIYQVTSHGEATLPDGFVNALNKQNITLNDLNLNDYENMPEDALCVFMLGPVNDLSDSDLDKIEAYLDNGGKMVIATNEYYVSQVDEKLENFEKLLSYFGIKQIEGLVGDEDRYSLTYQSYYYVYPEIVSTKYTSDLSNYLFAPLAQAFTYEEKDDVTITTMLTSSENAFVADIYTNEVLSEGQYDLAYYVTSEADMEAVVLGTPYIFDDVADDEVSGSNLKFFNNIVIDFADVELTSTIDIKYYEIANLVVDSSEGKMWAALLGLLLPGLVFVSGLTVWIARRKKN